MRREQAESTAEALRAAGVPAIALAANVADQAEMDAATAAVEREFGRIDVLMNKRRDLSGHGYGRPVARVPTPHP